MSQYLTKFAVGVPFSHASADPVVVHGYLDSPFPCYLDCFLFHCVSRFNLYFCLCFNQNVNANIKRGFEINKYLFASDKYKIVKFKLKLVQIIDHERFDYKRNFAKKWDYFNLCR